jgi:hypothetical protein
MMLKDEYWATFSIYDHRTPLYRQALLLFDRIVVPVPKNPIGSLTQQEIDKLVKDVEYLKTHEAAKIVDWDLDSFQFWKDKILADQAGRQEALARYLAKDPPYSTRLQLKEDVDREAQTHLPPGVLSVTAVPVYATQQAYEASAAELRNEVQERVTLEVLFPQLPMPAESASFDDILAVREKPSFQASLAALREWQRKTVAELLVENNEANVRRATRDFSEMIGKYSEALNNARYEKVTTAIASALALGAAFSGMLGPLLGTMAAVATPLFSVRKLIQPCWKDLEDRQCFPAGVIYNASKLA